MVRLITRHEWRGLTRDHRLWWLAVSLLLLTVVSGAGGVSSHQTLVCLVLVVSATGWWRLRRTFQPR